MAYKVIHETFWTDPKLRELTPIERYLFMYLITSPHSHFSGLYYLPKSIIIEETGIKDRDINRGIDTLIQRNFIKYDPYRSIVFVVKMLKYQIKDAKLNDKQRTGLLKHFERLHNTPLINDFIHFWPHLNLEYTTKENTPIDRGIDRGINTPMDRGMDRDTNRVLYTDTDIDIDISDSDIDKDSNKGGIVKGGIVKGEHFKEIISDLNEKTGKTYKATNSTKTLIRARLLEGFTLEDFKRVHENMSAKWKGDPKMDRFLRPVTLYQASKFESYLNSAVSLSDRGIVSELTEKNLKVLENYKFGGENDAK